ncbi:MAG: hypothetical protein DMG13_27825 [Acidobacteria bacterium]|nr:MAG: hypothetical protein DMG13_27825 [Acidobacteriota bacterium]
MSTGFDEPARSDPQAHNTCLPEADLSSPKSAASKGNTMEPETLLIVVVQNVTLITRARRSAKWHTQQTQNGKFAVFVLFEALHNLLKQKN